MNYTDRASASERTPCADRRQGQDASVHLHQRGALSGERCDSLFDLCHVKTKLGLSRREVGGEHSQRGTSKSARARDTAGTARVCGYTVSPLQSKVARNRERTQAQAEAKVHPQQTERSRHRDRMQS